MKRVQDVFYRLVCFLKLRINLAQILEYCTVNTVRKCLRISLCMYVTDDARYCKALYDVKFSQIEEMVDKFVTYEVSIGLIRYTF